MLNKCSDKSPNVRSDLRVCVTPYLTAAAAQDCDKRLAVRSSVGPSVFGAPLQHAR
jgi:predicted DNA-binding ribbon-helix-helix protein